MRRAFRYMLRAVAGLLLVVLLLPLVLYVPVVQRTLVGCAERWINGHTDMAVSVGGLSLRFPLSLSLDDVVVGNAPGDTLAALGSARVRVELLPLLRRRAVIPDITLTDVRFGYSAADSSLRLAVAAGSLRLAGGAVALADNRVHVRSLSLGQARVSLTILPVAEADTSASSAMPAWDIDVDDIALDEIDYEMYMPPVADTLQARVSQAEVSSALVSLGSRRVTVGQVTVRGGDYRFVASPADTLAVASADTSATTVPADSLAADEPWQVAVGKVQLAGNRAAYLSGTAAVLPGQFDASHIVADRVNVLLSSVYNCGDSLSLHVDSLSLNERSGLALSQAAGGFAMRGSRLRVQDFDVVTPFSTIHVTADADLQFFDQNPDARIDASVRACVALADAERLYPGIRSFYLHPRPYAGDWMPRAAAALEQITADAYLHGTCEMLSVERLKVAQPGIFTVDVQGNASSIWDEARRRVDVTCRAATTSSLSLQSFITDTALLGQVTVKPLHLDARLGLQGDAARMRLFLDCLDGGIALRGACNLADERYHVGVAIHDFPIDSLLPSLGLGACRARLQAEGRHYDIADPATRIGVRFDLDSLLFRDYLYSGVGVVASLENSRWQLNVDGAPPALNIGVDAGGIYTPDLFVADLRADVGWLDLEALHFATDTLTVQGKLTAQLVASRNDSLLQADVAIDSLRLGLGSYRYRADRIGCVAASDITYSYVDVTTGDLNANLTSDVGLGRLNPSLERLTQFVDTILHRQRLDMEELHRGLPPFTIAVRAGRDNIVQQYLNSMGVEFASLRLGAGNDSLFAVSGEVLRLAVSGIVLDTVTLDAHEASRRLDYRLALRNKPGNLDAFAGVTVEGFLSGNSTRLLCTQVNRLGESGFRFGCKVDFLDSLLTLSFGPQEPVIGYKKWTLNRGNFLSYNHVSRDIEADINLTYADSRLSLSTAARRDKAVEGVHLDIRNFKLSDWLVASPFMPPVDAGISADVYLDLPRNGIDALGSISIDSLTYAGRQVASFGVHAAYRVDSAGVAGINASLRVDTARVLTLMASSEAATQRVSGRVQVERFPLSVANPFIPAKTGSLAGSLSADITLSGTSALPVADGFVRLDDARASITAVGASLAFDNRDITIRHNKISLDRYAITGVNGNPLNISGSIDFSDPSRVPVSLDVLARNFEPVHSSESRTAMLYGSVFTDVAARVSGTLDNLSVGGRISLLSGTNATYVMQEGGMQTGQDYSDMVTFVSFADTVETYEKIAAVPASSGMNINATVDIEIDPGAQLGIDLSPGGNNRIDLIGGGNLLYTMTTLGDNRFTGRYNLTGGFVRYNPPILSQKIFNIQEGSYVMWNGDIADPSLNIKAVQRQRSSVSDGDKGSRPVEFDITIYVTNTLDNLGISFDLATTDDLAIQNELQGLTAEQRSSKAINMLLYNSYTDITSTASLAGNPLNAFLEGEINSWAQKTLKGIDLSFGINNYGDDGTGTQRTDYSYKFSKSLFDNRLKVVIGGSYATNQDATQNLKENLIDDISLEYRLTSRENMYLRAFRHTGYESIIEGEITQTGVGFLYRKQLMSLLDLFRKKKSGQPAGTAPSSSSAPADTTAIPAAQPRKEEVAP